MSSLSFLLSFFVSIGCVVMLIKAMLVQIVIYFGPYPDAFCEQVVERYRNILIQQIDNYEKKDSLHSLSNLSNKVNALKVDYKYCFTTSYFEDSLSKQIAKMLKLHLHMAKSKKYHSVCTTHSKNILLDVIAILKFHKGLGKSSRLFFGFENNIGKNSIIRDKVIELDQFLRKQNSCFHFHFVNATSAVLQKFKNEYVRDKSFSIKPSRYLVKKAKPKLIAGYVLFSISFAALVIPSAALIQFKPESFTGFIPVIGPFVFFAQALTGSYFNSSDNYAYGFGLAFVLLDAIVQVIGFALILSGHFDLRSSYSSHLSSQVDYQRRREERKKVSWRISPIISDKQIGIGVSGVFY